MAAERSGAWRMSVREERAADAIRKQVVEEEMQLHHPADPMAGVAVHRNDGLKADLEILTRPDNAGLDRAGDLPVAAAVKAPRECELDQRDHPVERRLQPDVAYVMLQIFQA